MSGNWRNDIYLLRKEIKKESELGIIYHLEQMILDIESNYGKLDDALEKIRNIKKMEAPYDGIRLNECVRIAKEGLKND